jgi:hypothetical protein
MSLDSIDTIDLVGLEQATGVAVLTIADGWDWSDEKAHVVALQAKFYRYLDFIESGQLIETEPDAEGRPIRIDIITRFPMTDRGLRFVDAITSYAAGLGVAVAYKRWPGIVG